MLSTENDCFQMNSQFLVNEPGYLLQVVQVYLFSIAFDGSVRPALKVQLLLSDLHPISGSSHRPRGHSALPVQEAHPAPSTCSSGSVSLIGLRFIYAFTKSCSPRNSCPSPSVTTRPSSSLTSTSVSIRGAPRGTEGSPL